ncbi:MAG: hypothetical protein SVZ03_00725 [Spirochaetota bacterium]|nr:hypothetical protein [Spirochaetota bacterium]
MRNYFRNKVQSDYKLDNQKNSILLKEYSQVSIRREIEKSFTKIYDTKKHSYSNKFLPDNQNQSAYYNTLLNKNWYSDNLYLADSVYNIDLYEAYIRNIDVIRLATLLIKLINNNLFMTSENRFGNDFYDYCRDISIELDIFQGIDDTDLIEIYLKQMVIIMKRSELLHYVDDIAIVENYFTSCNSMFSLLFSSFWNIVKWEEIFTSAPDVANELREHRNVLANLMIRQTSSFRIDKIANIFFELTGFGRINDLYLISFIDFYFFTWLKHFGILRYLDGELNEPVAVELTDFGNKLLQNL